MGSHRITILVFRNHIGLIASIGRIGQSGADDGIFHIVEKLLVFGICHLCFIHPKTVYGYIFYRCILAPKRVLVGKSHLEIASVDSYHTIRGRFVETPATDPHNLSAPSGDRS